MSWSDEGTPPVIDRSEYRRTESERKEAWSRWESLEASTPDQLKRAAEIVKWMPEGVAPGITCAPETGRLGHVDCEVLGVNALNVDYEDGSIALEVDHQRYPDREPVGGPALKYWLKLRGALDFHVNLPSNVHGNLVEGRIGGEAPLKSETSFWVDGGRDQLKCRLNWRRRGERPNEKWGWETWCDWMTPEEALTHNPVLYKHIAQLEKREGFRYPRLKDISPAEEVQALVKSWSEIRRCPV